MMMSDVCALLLSAFSEQMLMKHDDCSAVPICLLVHVTICAADVLQVCGMPSNSQKRTRMWGVKSACLDKTDVY